MFFCPCMVQATPFVIQLSIMACLVNLQFIEVSLGHHTVFIFWQDNLNKPE